MRIDTRTYQEAMGAVRELFPKDDSRVGSPPEVLGAQGVMERATPMFPRDDSPEGYYLAAQLYWQSARPSPGYEKLIPELSDTAFLARLERGMQLGRELLELYEAGANHE